MKRSLTIVLLFSVVSLPFGVNQTQSALLARPSSVAAMNAEILAALAQAKQNVTAVLEHSENVICAESITQIVLGKNGKPAYREESRYDYQLQTVSLNGSLKLKESREAQKMPFRDPSRTLLITNGFAGMLLIVHPGYETSYQFEAAGEDTSDNVTLFKINYKPIAGGSSPAALQLRGKNYPLPLAGTIWIEKTSGAIVRLTATLDSDMSDLGLQGMRSDIHYALVQFHDPEESYWMPVSATIDLESPKQHWRNIHRFTAYRRFLGKMRIEPRPQL
jgi:hypothetical protein